MPTNKLNHEGNRFKVCLICLQKSGGQKLPHGGSILQKHPDASFLCEQEDVLPKGLCKSCETILKSLSSQKPRNLPNVDYNGLVEDIMKYADTEADQCNCEVCKSGQYKGSKKFESRYILSEKRKRGRSVTQADDNGVSTSRNKSPPSATALCAKCLGVYAKGNHENCGSDDKIDNMYDILTKEEIDDLACRVLRERYKVADAKNEKTIKLASKDGPPMEVPTPKAAASLSFLAATFFKKVKSKFVTSTNSLYELAKIYKEETGGSVVPYLKDNLTMENVILDDYFEVILMQFVCDSDEDDEKFDIIETRGPNGEFEIAAPDNSESGKRALRGRYIVKCKDVLALINYLKEERHISKDTVVKIGIDGGQGFLKVVLILQEMEDSNDGKSPVKKKNKKYDAEGVKKCLVLFIGEKIPESYDNVKKIFEELNLFDEGIVDDVSFASDMKLINIMVGMQSESCMHGCAWCEVPTKGDIAYHEQDQWSLRTLGKMKRQGEQFEKDGSKLKNAHYYQNVINIPILKGNPEQTVLELIPPPQLDLYEGITNKIFDSLESEMNKLKGEKQVNQTAYEWAHERPRCITQEKYHGAKLNVQNCEKLMKYVDDLIQFLPESMKLFGKALKSFNKVAKSCFGIVLLPSWSQDIKDFLEIYDQLGIGYTPKVHVLVVHVKQFIDAQEKALGIFIEKPFEPLHADFKNVWKEYYCGRNIKTDPHKLGDCVVAYNCLNL